jgi:hypothetical protein
MYLSGLVFVESVMDKYDAPIDLIVGGHALADSDYGVPGPQSRAFAQIPLPTRAAASSTAANRAKPPPRTRNLYLPPGVPPSASY